MANRKPSKMENNSVPLLGNDIKSRRKALIMITNIIIACYYLTSFLVSNGFATRIVFDALIILVENGANVFVWQKKIETKIRIEIKKMPNGKEFYLVLSL